MKQDRLISENGQDSPFDTRDALYSEWETICESVWHTDLTSAFQLLEQLGHSAPARANEDVLKDVRRRLHTVLLKKKQVMLRAGILKSNLPSAGGSASDVDDRPGGKGISAVRGKWHTAREIADAARNSLTTGAELKKNWDKRRDFYPKPKRKRGKQTYEYDARAVLAQAVSMGDITKADMDRALIDLGLEKPIAKPTAKASQPPAKK